MSDIYRGQKFDAVKLCGELEEWRSTTGKRIDWIDGKGRLTVGQVESCAKRLMDIHSTDQCLVIVDYLQLWAKAQTGGNATVRDRVERLAAELMGLAGDLNSPVLALSSLSRASNYGNDSQGGASVRKELSMSDLKESGDIEFTADAVLLLQNRRKPEIADTNNKKTLELKLDKNRHGPVGEKIDILYRPAINQMSEIDRRYNEQAA